MGKWPVLFILAAAVGVVLVALFMVRNGRYRDFLPRRRIDVSLSDFF